MSKNPISHAGDSARSNLLLTGLFLLLVPAFCLIFANIGFWLGYPLTCFVFPSVIIAVSLIIILLKNKGSGWINALAPIMLGYLITTVCIIASYFTDDASFDGIIYHQEIIVCLLRGWNPLESYSAGCIDPDLELLVAHYAKGVEVMASVVASCFESIETGKTVNFLTVIGASLVVAEVTKGKFFIAGRWRILAVALLSVANPVVISQLFTYYNDFYIYFVVLLAIILFISGYSRFSILHYLGLVLLIIVSASIKFTVFFYAGLTVLFCLIWYAVKGKWAEVWKIGVWAVVSALIGVAIVSYHPYITNWIHVGNPCYPLIGEGSIDIMTGNTPGLYINHNRFVNFILSIFSSGWNCSPDARIGGFGPAMPLILLLSIAIITYGVIKKHLQGVMLYSALLILCSCFIFEQTWWARYIPFLWLLPLEATIVAFGLSKNWRLIGWINAGLGILTGVLIFTQSFYSALQLHIGRSEIAAMLDDTPAYIDTGVIIGSNGDISSRGVNGVIRHLEERGIEIIGINESQTDGMGSVSVTGPYHFPAQVILYFPAEKEKEVRSRFEGSSKSRVFRLQRYLPEKD